MIPLEKDDATRAFFRFMRLREKAFYSPTKDSD